MLENQQNKITELEFDLVSKVRMATTYSLDNLKNLVTRVGNQDKNIIENKK